MLTSLKAEIKRLSARSFRRAAQVKKTENKYRKQFEKRTGMSAGSPTIQIKNHMHRQYDPVYCARNANFLAKTIWHKVLSKSYEPIPAINYQIPKPDGGRRSIMAFSIPDAALANVILRRTRSRNLKRLSPSSYAYHPDKNVFDAVIALNDFPNAGKLFAVQIDFEKYFDNIPTRYLRSKINDADSISLTPHERYVFDRFLRHQYAEPDSYQVGIFKRRMTGTPQGSSVSLLLANVANHDLDISLTGAAGRFVRFADDVVAICEDYESALDIEKCFLDHCRKSGITVNAHKSPGIAIISGATHEMRTYGWFDYLGYRFSKDGLTLPDKTVRKLKSKVSRLCNIYLINYLSKGVAHGRCGVSPLRFDWDLLGMIFEVRNALYGGLSEADLKSFTDGGKRLPRMKGLMGFYCLVEDPRPLRMLDGWMLSIVRRAMVQRNRILNQVYSISCPTPTNAELATGTWMDPAAWRGGVVPDFRMPSLVRGWRAARKHYFTFGLEDVEAPDYGGYGGFDAAFPEY